MPVHICDGRNLPPLVVIVNISVKTAVLPLITHTIVAGLLWSEFSSTNGRFDGIILGGFVIITKSSITSRQHGLGQLATIAQLLSCYHHFDGFFDRTIPSKVPFPYLKTDGTRLLILFFIKNFEKREIQFLKEWFCQKIYKSDNNNWANVIW